MEKDNCKPRSGVPRHESSRKVEDSFIILSDILEWGPLSHAKDLQDSLERFTNKCIASLDWREQQHKEEMKAVRPPYSTGRRQDDRTAQLQTVAGFCERVKFTPELEPHVNHRAPFKIWKQVGV